MEIEESFVIDYLGDYNLTKDGYIEVLQHITCQGCRAVGYDFIRMDQVINDVLTQARCFYCGWHLKVTSYDQAQEQNK